MSGRIPHVLHAFGEIAWAIIPAKLVAIGEFLRAYDAGARLSAEEIAAVVGAPRESSGGGGGAIAVIPIIGTIFPRAVPLEAISSGGAASCAEISAALKQALADESVSTIVFDIDSPGGDVQGLPELHAEMLRARETKRTVAVANTLAASAAYWLASAAGEVVASPSAMVGSIGVLTVHEDHSQAYAADGVVPTIVSAGKYKGEVSPFGPLSEEARATLQARVDAFYEMFVKGVAKGRGTTAAKVRSDFGEGRVVLASDALAAGMVDRVATFDETIQRLRGVRRGGNARAEIASALIASVHPARVRG